MGYLLHPVWKGRNQDIDEEVHENWMNVLESYTYKVRLLMSTISTKMKEAHFLVLLPKMRKECKV